MNYRLAYAIGFHPWEDLAEHPLVRRGRGDRAHDRRFPRTTGIVCPSTSVGLNSTSSAPA